MLLFILRVYSIILILMYVSLDRGFCERDISSIIKIDYHSYLIAGSVLFFESELVFGPI